MRRDPDRRARCERGTSEARAEFGPPATGRGAEPSRAPLRRSHGGSGRRASIRKRHRAPGRRRRYAPRTWWQWLGQSARRAEGSSYPQVSHRMRSLQGEVSHQERNCRKCENCTPFSHDSPTDQAPERPLATALCPAWEVGRLLRDHMDGSGAIWRLKNRRDGGSADGREGQRDHKGHRHQVANSHPHTLRP